jgi:hypothetical protein
MTMAARDWTPAKNSATMFVRAKPTVRKARRPIATAPDPIACRRLSAPASGGYIMSDMSAKIEIELAGGGQTVAPEP